MRQYSNILTVDINKKGVLDLDVVKGCTLGIAAHGENGCYQACYAATIAKFRGIDFSKSVVRKVHTKAQAIMIERAVKYSPYGMFRIGTMGDPCHAWEETVLTIEWLSPYAIPVIITKHWKRATDEQIERMVKCGAIINTSVSALDSSQHLSRRVFEIQRYASAGGISIARVVSCDFNIDDPIGASMDRTQRKLFAMHPMIDNPLRVTSMHHLVKSGIIRIRKVKDLSTVRTISMALDSSTYIGHCSQCSELCGAGLIDGHDIRPDSRQLNLLKGMTI